jgi:CheB methylesterase
MPHDPPAMRTEAEWFYSMIPGLIRPYGKAAAGMEDIKAEGGITFAQNTSTAKYDGMPAAPSIPDARTSFLRQRKWRRSCGASSIIPMFTRKDKMKRIRAQRSRVLRSPVRGTWQRTHQIHCSFVPRKIFHSGPRSTSQGQRGRFQPIQAEHDSPPRVAPDVAPQSGFVA